MNDNKKIIININETNRVQRYTKDNELFQIDAFKKVTKILQEHYTNKKDNIVNCRFHDTIFIDGDRGVGKTAFMINIEDYYKRKFKENELNKDDNKFIFLNSIDPTLLEHTEHFLSVVLAKVVKMVGDKLNNTQYKENKYIEKYYQTLENLSLSLKAIKTLEKDVGIEEIASSKSSLELEQYTHNFFRIVSKMLRVNGLVILIDDVDMAFDKGFDVLEVVRKYLASPYIIPIVAGDMKLYREIVEIKFINKINTEKKELLNNLVEQYLRKVFPSEYQIELKDIDTIRKEYEININLTKNLSESIDDIEKFESQHLNMGINQKEFQFSVFSNNTRDLIQYIYNKKEIYIQYFKDINKLILIKNSMNIYKHSFMKTAEFYKFSYNKKKKELSILSNNDYQSFDDNMYNLYKAFSSNLFSSMQKFKDAELSVYKFSISKHTLKTVLKKDDENNNTLNYIIDLFIFNDYYSSNQRKNYIYSGNFLESMIYSLSVEHQPNFIKKEVKDEVNSIIKNAKMLMNFII